MSTPTAPVPASPATALAARVSKRLLPGQNGTKRLQAEYGAALVCVRYRQDGRKRYTTVELVIDEQELPSPAPSIKQLVAVAIGYQEREQRNRAKQAGAVWDTNQRVWIMPRAVAVNLGMEDRIRPFSGDGQ